MNDGGGVHIWDVQLKTFSKLLYVRGVQFQQCTHGKLTRSLGCPCPFDHLHFRCFLYQTLDPPPILANFCPQPKTQHGYVPHNTCCDLEYRSLLLTEHGILPRHMQSPQEDLAAMADLRPLLQFQHLELG